eukprot:scaffold6281_cov207-Ochromonas_danica.AAC.4
MEFHLIHYSMEVSFHSLFRGTSPVSFPLFAHDDQLEMTCAPVWVAKMIVWGTLGVGKKNRRFSQARLLLALKLYPEDVTSSACEKQTIESITTERNVINGKRQRTKFSSSVLHAMDGDSDEDSDGRTSRRRSSNGRRTSAKTNGVGGALVVSGNGPVQGSAAHDGNDHCNLEKLNSLQGLLGHLNEISITAPVSSIRCGTSVEGSQAESIKQLLHKLNLSVPISEPAGNSTSNGIFLNSANAVVEFHCILLGAKLNVLESATA